MLNIGSDPKHRRVSETCMMQCLLTSKEFLLIANHNVRRSVKKVSKHKEFAVLLLTACSDWFYCCYSA